MIRWAESKPTARRRAEGCAVAATAMVFKFYGIEFDPQQLNWFLTNVGGYTSKAGFIGTALPGSHLIVCDTFTKTWRRTS